MPAPGSVVLRTGTGGPLVGREQNDVFIWDVNSQEWFPGNVGGLPMKIINIPDAAVTLDASHANAYLRFAQACVVTVNQGVFGVGQFVIIRQVGAGVVSFAGTVVITPPTTNVATTGQQGATIALVFTGAAAADAMGDLSDA
jgi:hypothetical protein